MTDLNKAILTAICEVCKKRFTYYPLGSKGRFCSRQCYWKSKKGIIPKHVKLIKKGEHLSRATEFKKGSKGNFRNAIISSECLHCGKEIRDFQSSKRKFCSYDCYWKYKKEVWKKLWSQKEFKEKRIKAILKGLFKRPTSLEQEAINFFSKHNLPYKYTGDGSFIIGGKNPDFVNTNGEKKLIEIGNVFHHKGDYVKRRKEHFAKYGWQTYIFIGDELDEEKILNELKSK